MIMFSGLFRRHIILFLCTQVVIVLSYLWVRGRSCYSQTDLRGQEPFIPPYRFKSIASYETSNSESGLLKNFKLQPYVLSTSNSVPPYYFITFDPSVDIYVSAGMLGSEGYYDQFVNHIFQYHYANLEKRSSFKSTKKQHSCLSLDIGMNLGSFALFASSKNCEVYGFEIQSSVLFAVALAVRLNGFEDHLHLIRAAVSNISGSTVKVGVSGDHNIGNTAVVYDNDAATDETVVTVRIDEILNNFSHITFVKLDVEGSEWRALQGMTSFLQHHQIDGLVIEFRDDEQSRLWLNALYEWGYRCIDVNDVQYPLNVSNGLQTFPFCRTREEALKKLSTIGNFWCVAYDLF